MPSKASTWAMNVDSDSSGLSFVDEGARAYVTAWPGGVARLTVRLSLDSKYSNPTFDDPLALACWIIETFGEKTIRLTPSDDV